MTAATDRYARAQALLPANAAAELLGPLTAPVFATRAAALRLRFTGQGDRFSFGVRRDDGVEHLMADPASRTVEPAFDSERLATALGGCWAPLELEWVGAESACLVVAGGRRWRYDLADGAEPFPFGATDAVAPDGEAALVLTGHDLELVERSGRRMQLTGDGCEGATYAPPWPGDRFAAWSPDGRFVVAARLLLDGVRRPLPLACDEVVPRAELVVFTREGGRVDVDAEPLDAFWYPLDPFTGLVWWDAHGRLIVLRERRWNREIAFETVDPGTGTVTKLLESHSTTYRLPAAQRFPPREGFWALRDGRRAVCWSREQDGQGHLYLHEPGADPRPLTSGDWVAGSILHVDEAEGVVWFTGRGREPGEDPYHALLYRVALEGGGAPELLTPGGAHHELVALPGGGFVDTHGRLDSPLASQVLDRDGGVLMRLGETRPRSSLPRPPERTSAVGRDGQTELAAVIYRPSDFDSRASYPVVLHQYGVPSRINATVTLAGSEDFWWCQAVAELGFVVVQVDGMGTPLRSRAFHEVSYGDGFADASGLEDWVLALRQLAERDPSIDLTRVGVIGYSGGGYGAARALLARPDVFHVAVAAGGNHDQRLCDPGCSERWIGPPEERPQAWVVQANASLADRLEGELLLIHGEADAEVPVANTLQLADALTAAGRDFDLLVVPGADHASCKYHPDVIRRTWDYLVEHLQRREPRPR